MIYQIQAIIITNDGSQVIGYLKNQITSYVIDFDLYTCANTVFEKEFPSFMNSILIVETHKLLLRHFFVWIDAEVD